MLQNTRELHQNELRIGTRKMSRDSIIIVASCILALFASAKMPAQAQQAGPLSPAAPVTRPAPLPANKPDAPPVPPEEIIRRFAAKEDEMLRESMSYGFQKSVRLEEIGPDNKASGQVEIVTQQFVGPDGRRYEKPVRRTASTLQHLQVERGDSDLIASTPLFPLTTSQLPKYEITFQGKQPLDELSAYIFAVKPRAVDRAHAYFSGVVWVDEQDMVIVKTIGKWVMETGDVTSPMLPFTVFETYRQQVGKNLWFPAYSRSDETIPVDKTTLPVRIVIRWTDYTPAGAQSSAPPGGAKPADNKSNP
jgi:hypothetical protein